MNSALRLSDPLLPPPPGGLGRAALLALAVHGGLVAALAASVQWRAQPVPVVAAELWTIVPQQAAAAAPAAPAPQPPAQAAEAAPTPAPTPAPQAAPPAAPPRAAEPAPDIALERQRRESEREQERQAARERDQERERQRQVRLEAEQRERAEKAQREERERKAAEARLEQQRNENLRRLLGQASGVGAGGGSAPKDAAPSLAYGSRLIAHIKPNIVFTERIVGNPTAEVEVRAGPGGTIIARRLAKSSGSKEWDEAVLRAIDRTEVLPRDSDGRVPPLLIIGFRPND